MFKFFIFNFVHILVSLCEVVLDDNTKYSNEFFNVLYCWWKTVLFLNSSWYNRIIVAQQQKIKIRIMRSMLEAGNFFCFVYEIDNNCCGMIWIRWIFHLTMTQMKNISNVKIVLSEQKFYQGFSFLLFDTKQLSFLFDDWTRVLSVVHYWDKQASDKKSVEILNPSNTNSITSATLLPKCLC